MIQSAGPCIYLTYITAFIALHGGSGSGQNVVSQEDWNLTTSKRIWFLVNYVRMEAKLTLWPKHISTSERQKKLPDQITALVIFCSFCLHTKMNWSNIRTHQTTNHCHHTHLYSAVRNVFNTISEVLHK